MIAGEGTQLIRRAARDIFEFIVDFERYKKADHKIGTVHTVRWHGDHGEIHYDARFRGVPTPAVRQRITVQPFRRIDIRSTPGTFAHFMGPFHGLFTFEELGDGVTRVFHREEMSFRAPFKWVIEPLLRRWLADDVRQEVLRLKKLLEASDDPRAPR